MHIKREFAEYSVCTVYINQERRGIDRKATQKAKCKKENRKAFFVGQKNSGHVQGKKA